MKIKKVQWLALDALIMQTLLPYCVVLGYDFRDRSERCAHAFATHEEFADYIDALIAIYEPHERPNIVYVQFIK